MPCQPPAELIEIVRDLTRRTADLELELLARRIEEESARLPRDDDRR